MGKKAFRKHNLGPCPSRRQEGLASKVELCSCMKFARAAIMQRLCPSLLAAFFERYKKSLHCASKRLFEAALIRVLKEPPRRRPALAPCSSGATRGCRLRSRAASRRATDAPPRSRPCNRSHQAPAEAAAWEGGRPRGHHTDGSCHAEHALFITE
eukprot:6182911-Pleurochrysis_carterae.AAC.1